MTAAAPPATAMRANPGRWKAFAILGLAVAAAGLGWAGYDFIFAAGVETTDDAYVSGDVVQITSEQAGTVIGLHVDDTQTVTAGNPVIDLDPADAKIAMDAAKAGLAQAVRNVKATLAQADQLRAQIAMREADLRRADDDTRRRGALIATGAVSREDFAHAQDNVAAQTAALLAARAELEQTLVKLGQTPIALHPDVLAAASKLRTAALAVRRTSIVAPSDGVIARRGVQVGQRVDTTTPLMAVVPLNDVWIDANFKEVQLRNMRIGQKVKITTDLYGRAVTYDGTVAGIAAGSGSAFALLPAQNATGNWIKIVQRVPVRILIDPNELKANPLRIGLSANVSVDVGDSSGPMIASRVRNQPFAAKRGDGGDPAVDALIAGIIAENGGSAETTTAGSK
jgi:membrane fusion protein (multidrug efflux system)